MPEPHALSLVHPLVWVWVALMLGLFWAAWYCKIRPYDVRPYEVSDPKGSTMAESEHYIDDMLNEWPAQDVARARQEREFLGGVASGSSAGEWAIAIGALVLIGIVAELLQLIVGSN
jgi:hypothetical protein